MAINVQTLQEVIADFSALNYKDAVTPYTLGAILQRIAVLLRDAGTSETIANINRLLDGFKAAGCAITSVLQGQTDRNHVYANFGKVDLTTGASSTASTLFIQQATTERAGAMRAQQVTDLNNARRGVADLQAKMTELENQLKALLASVSGGADVDLIGGAQTFAVEIEDSRVKLRGVSSLVAKGYVPYLFRHIKKRNQFHKRHRTEAEMGRKYCSERKGWCMYGSQYSVQLAADTLMFSLKPHSTIVEGSDYYGFEPSALVREHTDRNGHKSVGWGRSTILLHNKKDNYSPRMVRLRFGVAFGKPHYHGCIRLTPANMVTPLVEFSIVYEPKTKCWTFSK